MLQLKFCRWNCTHYGYSRRLTQRELANRLHSAQVVRSARFDYHYCYGEKQMPKRSGNVSRKIHAEKFYAPLQAMRLAKETSTTSFDNC